MVMSCEWSEIEKIVAYKLDCFTFDQIRFLISAKDGGIREITEDDPGFWELVTEMEKALNISPDWHKVVAHPPMQRCETVLYENGAPTEF